MARFHNLLLYIMLHILSTKRKSLRGYYFSYLIPVCPRDGLNNFNQAYLTFVELLFLYTLLSS